jgi:hypothetical protein
VAAGYGRTQPEPSWSLALSSSLSVPTSLSLSATLSFASSLSFSATLSLSSSLALSAQSLSLSASFAQSYQVRASARSLLSLHSKLILTGPLLGALPPPRKGDYLRFSFLFLRSAAHA